MTEKEYRSHPAISRSELWRMHYGAEKFKWYMDNPPEPTKALLFGQVVHKLLLEPDDFYNEFAVAPAVKRNTVVGKQIWSDFEEQNVGKSVVPQDMATQAAEMVYAAKQNVMVCKLLDGEHEKPIFWTDTDTGEQCKSRLDILTYVHGKPIIVDYKSAANASTESFMRAAITVPGSDRCYGYDMQSAMYSDGLKVSLGLDETPGFVFIVQEKEPPYSLNILQVEEEVMTHGYDVFREYLGMYHRCKESGTWPGYLGEYEIINSLSLPAWMRGE